MFVFLGSNTLMFGHTIGGVFQIIEGFIGIIVLAYIGASSLTEICCRPKVKTEESNARKTSKWLPEWYHIFFPRFSGGGPYYPYENQFKTKSTAVTKITWYTEYSKFGAEKHTKNGSGMAERVANSGANRNNSNQTETSNLIETQNPTSPIIETQLNPSSRSTGDKSKKYLFEGLHLNTKEYKLIPEYTKQGKHS